MDDVLLPFNCIRNEILHPYKHTLPKLPIMHKVINPYKK